MSRTIAANRLPWRPLRIASVLMPVLLVAANAQQPPASIPTTAPGASEAKQQMPDSSAPALDMVQADITASPGRLTPDERILEVLERFTFGPRPGDLEALRAEGLNHWFSRQLNPGTIDDSALDRRLAEYPAMQLPLDRMVELYPNGAMVRQAMNGRGGIPSGEGERAIYKAQEQRIDQKKNKSADTNAAAAASPPMLALDVATVLAMPAEDRFKALLKLTPSQLSALRHAMDPNQKTALVAGLTPHQLEVLAALNNPQGVVVSELVQTRLLRDIYTERQLQEVMTDFWLNHFNVYLRKSQEAPYFIASFQRDTIRPRALGHFEDLLVATAASPAMLNYLDNQESIGPNSPAASPLYNRNAARQKAASGLNENYARELMELHTLGVNGGYTQKDVTEVAKVFTGWTIGRGYGNGEPVHVEFDISRHEPGPKVVLGVKIQQNGLREGFEVLHLLATSPQTAHFLSAKLATRFVSDDPPPALVDRMAQTYLRTNGDIRMVLITMINSPEFFSRATYRAKVKTPQDFVVSAVRASGAEVESAGALASSIADLGMPVFGMQTPQGYSMRTDAWNNTADLISRMNFALALSSNRIAGVEVNWVAALKASSKTAPESLASLPPESKERLLEEHLLHAAASNRTRSTILAQITADPRQQRASLNQVSAKGVRDPLSTLRIADAGHPAPVLDPQTALAAGLLFGSPEFQRR